jgi:hypothetical protein
VTLATDLLYHWGSREATATVGYDVTLRQARLQGKVDSAGGRVLQTFVPQIFVKPASKIKNVSWYFIGAEAALLRLEAAWLAGAPCGTLPKPADERLLLCVVLLARPGVCKNCHAWWCACFSDYFRMKCHRRCVVSCVVSCHTLDC